VASKLVALILGGVCVYARKQNLIRWVSYWYAGLVVWNLMVMLTSPGHAG
jgi:hypothetical protein